MQPLTKLKKRLHTVTEIDIHDNVVNVPFFENNEGFHISAEEENSYLFLDYYGEYRGGYPWIHPNLETLAVECGGYWEWVNPACIVFIEN